MPDIPTCSTPLQNKKYKAIIRHCSGSANNQNNNQSTFVSNQDARCPNALLGLLTAPGQKNKNNNQPWWQKINKNRNQSMYNAATGSWYPNAKIMTSPMLPPIVVRRRKAGGKMVRQRKREQLTFVVATCTSSVLMHHQC